MDKGAKAARLADLLRDYLAMWLKRDYPGRLISVSDIQMSPNGQRATVWLSAFDTKAIEAMQDAIHHTAKYQHLMHAALDRRFVPELKFVADMPDA